MDRTYHYLDVMPLLIYYSITSGTVQDGMRALRLPHAFTAAARRADARARAPLRCLLRAVDGGAPPHYTTCPTPPYPPPYPTASEDGAVLLPLPWYLLLCRYYPDAPQRHADTCLSAANNMPTQPKRDRVSFVAFLIPLFRPTIINSLCNYVGLQCYSAGLFWLFPWVTTARPTLPTHP